MYHRPTTHPAYSCAPESMETGGRQGLMETDGRQGSMETGDRPELGGKPGLGGMPELAGGMPGLAGDMPGPGDRSEPADDMPGPDGIGPMPSQKQTTVLKPKAGDC
jgi:hypothetical protein